MWMASNVWLIRNVGRSLLTNWARGLRAKVKLFVFVYDILFYCG